MSAIAAGGGAAAKAAAARGAKPKGMRTAATIIVAAPYKSVGNVKAGAAVAAAATSGSANGTGATGFNALADYRVLFIKRSDKMHFMASAHAFPGGVVEPCDHTDWAAALATVVTADAKAAAASPLRADEHEQIGFRVAAIRELFEETGLLLAKPVAVAAAANDAAASGGGGSGDGVTYASLFVPPNGVAATDPCSGASLAALRERVHDDATCFHTELFTRRNLMPDVGALFPLSRWVTPPHVGAGGKRFDTWFYVALLRAPPPPECDAMADRTETSHAAWHAVPDMLAMGEAGTVALPPPTAYTCADVATSATLKQLYAAVQRRRLAPFTPTTVAAAEGSAEEGKVSMALPYDKDFVALAAPDFVNAVDDVARYRTPGGINRATMLSPQFWRMERKGVSLQWDALPPSTAAAPPVAAAATAVASKL